EGDDIRDRNVTGVQTCALPIFTGKDVQINIFEIKRPEIDSRLVGESIAQQLEARISYRRAMKQAIASAMRVGAQGIKVKVSGRQIGRATCREREEYEAGGGVVR